MFERFSHYILRCRAARTWLTFVQRSMRRCTTVQIQLHVIFKVPFMEKILLTRKVENFSSKKG